MAFRNHLAIAAAGWAYLAFGDGFATLAGSHWGAAPRARLPWNSAKSWPGLIAYVIFGGSAAALLYGFVASRSLSLEEIVLLFLSAVVGAAVESLPSELDDNLFPPLVAAAALAALLPTIPGWGAVLSTGFLTRAALGAGVNLAVSVGAAALRIVRPSGAIVGGLAGTLVFAFGGWKAYALLWVFFGLGTIATRFGKARKEAMGRAEEAGGRRGAANVLANVSVAAFCVAVAFALPGNEAARYSLAAAAAFATALMDTIGTEVGQAVKSPTVLLPDFRPVPPGTDGAVSIAGTLAGLFGAGLMAAAAAALGLVTGAGAAVVVAAAAAGTIVESLLGRSGASWRVSNGHVLNFYNTLAGAAVACWLVPFAGGAR